MRAASRRRWLVDEGKPSGLIGLPTLLAIAGGFVASELSCVFISLCGPAHILEAAEADQVFDRSLVLAQAGSAYRRLRLPAVN